MRKHKSTDDMTLDELREAVIKREQELKPLSKKDQIIALNGICPGCKKIETDYTRWSSVRKTFLVCLSCYQIALHCDLMNKEELFAVLEFITNLKSKRLVSRSLRDPV